MKLTRRQTLPLVGLAALGGARVSAAEPTPSCGDAHQTPTNDEGPYFKPSSPLRGNLLDAGMEGDKLVITGRVISRSCAPMKNALLDFWQADALGQYDNDGFTLRGHQFTDDNGNYRLETVRPGLYPGRTRHIHVKVVAPEKLILTTQLYFPKEPRNASDRLFRNDLVLALDDSAKTKTARFDFVLNWI